MASPRSDLYIGGAFRPAHSGATVTLTNPATEQVITTVPEAGAEDVDAAVRAARGALGEWSALQPKERADVLDAVADAYDARSDEIKSLITEQNGSPQWWTGFTDGAGTYRFAAMLARQFEVEELSEMLGSRGIIRREAVGVVAAIVPWNAPQALLGGKVGMALAAGCTVVAKPSPETSLDALVLGEVFMAAGIPAGVMNIVTGGAPTGDALVRHDGVDKVAFTGSTATGRAIGAICGERLTPLTAELGGKSAALLLDDADLDVFAAAINPQCIPYSGQVCFAASRVLAPRSRLGEVLDAITTTLEATQVGDPSDPATTIGPIVTARQRDRVESYIRYGLDEGAKAVLGGGRPAGLDRGYYVSPTVFSDVTPRMRIFQEEIFGPVLTVTAYDDEQDAIALHNDSQYGLNGLVYSGDVGRATDVARRLETGRVCVNGDWGPPNPFSGYKNSGVNGGGFERIEEYVQVKTISQPTA
ncbi:aldehyde dehydrogenase family protein [Jatrophihabitans fulvus]